MLFTTPLALLLATAAALTSAASAPATRATWNPPVLYPHAGTVWSSGQHHNVTWDNSNPPANITERSIVYLRSQTAQWPVILAHDFDLRAGRVEVALPELISGVYNVILIGGNGATSADFTVEGVLEL